MNVSDFLSYNGTVINQNASISQQTNALFFGILDFIKLLLIRFYVIWIVVFLIVILVFSKKNKKRFLR